MVVLMVVLVGVLGVGELTVGQGHLVTVQLGDTLSPPDWLLLVQLRCGGGRGGYRGRGGGGLRLSQAVEALGPGGEGGLAVERLGGLSLDPGGGQTEIIFPF